MVKACIDKPEASVFVMEVIEWEEGCISAAV